MLHKILYPTDFSDVSQEALEYVKRLKESGAREVVLMHVIEPIPNLVKAELCQPGSQEEGDLPAIGETPELCDPERRAEHCKDELAAVENELRDVGFLVRTRMCEGSPLKQILSVEAEEGVSMIVMGSHGKSNVEGMILGSVSEEVIRRCKMPVLVIKKGTA